MTPDRRQDREPPYVEMRQVGYVNGELFRIRRHFPFRPLSREWVDALGVPPVPVYDWQGLVSPEALDRFRETMGND
jgi:hypothetical protein